MSTLASTPSVRAVGERPRSRRQISSVSSTNGPPGTPRHCPRLLIRHFAAHQRRHQQDDVSPPRGCVAQRSQRCRHSRLDLLGLTGVVGNASGALHYHRVDLQPGLPRRARDLFGLRRIGDGVHLEMTEPRPRRQLEAFAVAQTPRQHLDAERLDEGPGGSRRVSGKLQVTSRMRFRGGYNTHKLRSWSRNRVGVLAINAAKVKGGVPLQTGRRRANLAPRGMRAPRCDPTSWYGPGE